MRIGGFVSVSLCDYPGQVASVVFTQGCNYRCPFCHNSRLIPAASNELLWTWDFLEHHFLERRGKVKAIVLSGGEPTIQPDLVEKCSALKGQGFLVKLDTNGSRPGVLERLLKHRLVDYVAMDLKAPLERYHLLTGVKACVESVQSSMDLLSSSCVDHEFRTTVVPGLHRPGDVEHCRSMVPEGSRYVLQKAKNVDVNGIFAGKVS